VNDSRDESTTGDGPEHGSAGGPVYDGSNAAGGADSSFARIERAFESLRGVDAKARAEGLAAIGDAAERADVERLLRMHDEAEASGGTAALQVHGLDLSGEPLSGTAIAGALDAAGLGATDLAHLDAAVRSGLPLGDPPPAVPRWRATREIGRGGMGRVWLAERIDADFRQLGALKVLRPGLDEGGGDFAQRFRAERQILARLDHPNVAKVLDGGAASDGRQFVVMEYVDGEDLVTWCQRRDLDVRARVELFCKVCAAVEHAHAALVVHRDLKPSNVLVSRADGEPRLLDFGIAKLLAPDGSIESARTLTGRMVFTPEYASPEQVRGSEHVTVATDVYALGLVLYEVLTGVRAQTFTSVGATELARVVCERDPMLPSLARTGRGRGRTPATARLGRQLAGDLDAIVMKALRKEPEHRYGSAASLEEDLQRYLEGMPVRARRGTAAYRAARFVRRNRLPLAAASLVFVFVVAAAILLGIQARTLTRQRDELEQQSKTLQQRSDELRSQRDLARRESESSRAVADFLVDLFDVSRANAAQADTLTARQILDIGARRIDANRGADPLVRASLLSAMGNAYRALATFDDADRLLEESLAIRAERGSPVEHAEGLAAVAMLRRGQGRFAEAIALDEKALALLDDEPAQGALQLPARMNRAVLRFEFALHAGLRVVRHRRPRRSRCVASTRRRGAAHGGRTLVARVRRGERRCRRCGCWARRLLDARPRFGGGGGRLPCGPRCRSSGGTTTARSARSTRLSRRRGAAATGARSPMRSRSSARSTRSAATSKRRVCASRRRFRSTARCSATRIRASTATSTRSRRFSRSSVGTKKPRRCCARSFATTASGSDAIRAPRCRSAGSRACSYGRVPSARRSRSTTRRSRSSATHCPKATSRSPTRCRTSGSRTRMPAAPTSRAPCSKRRCRSASRSSKRTIRRF
jgi:tetratricopeptide (TPR) repeat protein